MANLRGQVALVTGASQGIGRSIAIALAEAGADVAINYQSNTKAAQEVQAACQAAGVRARLAQADVARQADVERIVAETIAEFGRLDIAVSNAVYSDRELFYTADMEGFRRTIDVSMWGALYLVRAAAQHMIERRDGGAIVVVSSPHSYVAYPKAMAYNMAKAANDQMARTAAAELYEFKIRVNIVHPGWTDTPGERKFYSEQDLDDGGGRIPAGRLGRPEEVARGVVFLCDPESEYINGTCLTIDGGITLPWWAKNRIPDRKPPGD
jgi:glucose 1-dehydrogenase